MHQLNSRDRDACPLYGESAHVAWVLKVELI